MELKEGYKQTDVGVIPEDWELQVLRDVASVKRGGSPRPIEAFITDNPEGVNWIKIGDTTKGGKYITSTKERIRTEGKSMSREVKIGQLLLSNSMSFGRPYLLKLDGCIHDGWLVLQDFELTLDNDFFYYLLSGNQILDQYKKLAAGSGVQNLNKEVVGNVILAFPKLKEQRAIAEVLSDVDAEIGEAKKLLVKKIRLKTGLERHLLTDDGSWMKCRFSDLLSFEQPQKYLVEAAQISETGEIPVLTPGKTFILGYCSSGVVGVDNQDSIECIVFDDFTTASKFVDFSFRLRSSAVKVLRAKGDVTHTRALEALLRKVRYKPEDHKRHWISQFQHFEVSVPDSSRLSEISLTIRDIDNEISSLEALIRRSQAKKEGLMQTLLTGKIRLT